MYELRRLFNAEQTRVLLFSLADGPTANVKDRVVRAMLEAAKNLGALAPNTKLIESTSGAEGVALASAAAGLGLELTIVAPDNLAPNVQARLETLGANIVLTPEKRGMTGALEELKKIKDSNPRYWSPNLFENPANPAIHEATTGVEIWQGAQGKLDAFVCAFGSGGTFTGAARYLKRKNASIQRIVVEPQESTVLSGVKQGKNHISGIGPGFVPKIFDRNLMTDVVTVSAEEAQEQTDRLAKTEGLLVGLSTGANLAAVAKLLQNQNYQNKTIATIAFDKIC